MSADIIAIPVRHVPHPPITPQFRRFALATEIREAAQDFADRLVRGEYDALGAGDRCDLAALSLAMAEWSERLEDML